ncbi:GEM-like protein 5 isoform X2 [Actinidia eriantha]|uniref:GEM-like protein 5 isoform X2 n=1 Tax=Actinidia eriantha TaxID=165200 RepID=UPI00258D301E|nr:GEM-like protein 5 isoform X2 [Actinidia eriantha]
MNHTSNQESQPHYPSLEAFPTPTQEPVLDQPPPPPSVTVASPPPYPQETQLPPPHAAGPSYPTSEPAEKWGTHIMGAPAVPTCHPGNKKAALWSADDQPQYHHHPYLHYSPIEKSTTSPMESILHMFNSWSNKAESTAQNIWHNLKTGSSVPEAAWNKVNLTAKAITGATGPVAGTLYLSNAHAAFCSDRPLSFTAPSGQESWSYYKIMVPLGKICAINPVVMRDNPLEKYLQVVTIDGHDFWFMGFVNYEKATRHLSESLGSFVAPGIAVQPVVT